jgi:hypothetical protein
MKVMELTRNELIELKINYLAEMQDGEVSFGEMAEADLIVSDATIFDYYGNIDFVKDDFFCNIA